MAIDDVEANQPAHHHRGDQDPEIDVENGDDKPQNGVHADFLSARDLGQM